MNCDPDEQGQVEALLQAEGFECRSSPLQATCRSLTKEPFPLGSSLAARFGLIYIQDKSSLLPPLALNPRPGEAVLDLCASPGSKAGLIASLVGPHGLVLANEPGAKRLQTLRRNLELLNLLQVCTANYSGQHFPFPKFDFDMILLDVPCSGWGTAEKHPRVTRIWREEKLAPLIALQRQLLTRAAELLAPGGRLVYSTCTTNRAENEEQIAWARQWTGLRCVRLFPLKGCYFLDTDQDCAPGSLLVDGPASGGQSFFLACLGKPGASSAAAAKTGAAGAPAGGPLVAADTEPQPEWSRLPAGEMRVESGRAVFQPLEASRRLAGKLTWRGLNMGKMSGERLLPSPHQRLLLPKGAATEGFQVEDTAPLRQLLSGQSLRADCRAKRLGLYWRGLPLGWLTVKGRRLLWSGRS